MEARHQNDFVRTLEATRREREGIEAQIAALDAQRDLLLVREERLRCDVEAQAEKPVLVRTAFLMEKPDVSRDGLDRLTRNPAKGFPRPIYGIDSHPRWNWREVEQWVEDQRSA